MNLWYRPDIRVFGQAYSIHSSGMVFLFVPPKTWLLKAGSLRISVFEYRHFRSVCRIRQEKCPTNSEVRLKILLSLSKPLEQTLDLNGIHFVHDRRRSASRYASFRGKQSLEYRSGSCR